MKTEVLDLLKKLTIIFFFLLLFCFSLALVSESLAKYLVLSSALFCLGICGFLRSQNLIKSLISLEILLNSAGINLVAFAQYTDLTMIRGQMFTMFIMAVAAAEVALGLALIILLYSKYKNSKVSSLNQLSEC